MADILPIVLLVGVAVGGAYLIMNKNQLFGGGGGGTAPATAAATATGSKVKTIPPAAIGDKYAIVNAKAGPANCASSDHEADKGFGFSKDGGPVEADGYTADEGEPRVGDNRNRNNMNISMLPGACETKPYKGKVQYRYRNLSASCETCQLAKQYFLYKYGIGGVWPVPGTNGGEGVREGGAKGPGVTRVLQNKGGGKAAAPKKKAKFAYAYNAGMIYTQFSPISTLYSEY